MTGPMRWPGRAPRHVEDAVDALFALYTERGHTHYDGAVDQTEHALQTAALAEAAGAEDTLVAAALLHDIGHLLVDEHDGQDEFLATDQHHERVGAAVLRRWFPPAVTGPVALHVPAKRYLVATDPGYLDTLSRASVASLAVQGGPMRAEAACTFSRRRYAESACRLRRWDDRAKTAGRVTPALEHYRAPVTSLLTLPGSRR